MDNSSKRPRTVRDPYAVEVGGRLREARIRRGLDITKASDLLDFDRQTITTWENGYAFPPYKKLRHMCNLYRCSVGEIITGEEPDTWPEVAVKLPVALREKVIIVADRPTVSSLIDDLNQMTDSQLQLLGTVLPHLAKAGDAGINGLATILNGVSGLIDNVATTGTR